MRGDRGSNPGPVGYRRHGVGTADATFSLPTLHDVPPCAYRPFVAHDEDRAVASPHGADSAGTGHRAKP
ncbi:hypothetical protein PR202_ga00617 [Eleusine coracana subsp. coracana]|uniref:Uncharacterized protein n=1 Tax=Eleusine coracana subsp. coracana TaxID=191504 RepID=A0AAV5BGR0_ELECO|nr:hypothetical protein PR202_ga00617 [Eleusine coracana subsp. coracana]